MASVKGSTCWVPWLTPFCTHALLLEPAGSSLHLPVILPPKTSAGWVGTGPHEAPPNASKRAAGSALIRRSLCIRSKEVVQHRVPVLQIHLPLEAQADPGNDELDDTQWHCPQRRPPHHPCVRGAPWQRLSVTARKVYVFRYCTCMMDNVHKSKYQIKSMSNI